MTLVTIGLFLHSGLLVTQWSPRFGSVRQQGLLPAGSKPSYLLPNSECMYGSIVYLNVQDHGYEFRRMHYERRGPGVLLPPNFFHLHPSPSAAPLTCLLPDDGGIEILSFN